MQTGHYQGVAAEIDRKRKAQPVANALLDLLVQESQSVDRTEAQRAALQIRAIGVSAHIARTWQDITQDEAMREMIAAGLAPEGTEPYVVLVDGKRVGGFLAGNKYHAVNKAKKEFGLHVAEYRRNGDANEVHGARFQAHSDEQGAEDIARIMRQDNPQPTAPEPAAPVAHVIGLDRNGTDKRWPVRATCSCGWLGIWHRGEPQTRASVRAHLEAHGVRA